MRAVRLFSLPNVKFPFSDSSGIFPPLTSSPMVGATRWTDCQCRALLGAVNLHGCRWALIARLRLVPGFDTARPLRLKYAHLRQTFVSPPPVVSPPSSLEACYQSGRSLAWPSPPRSRHARRPWPYFIRSRGTSRQPTTSQSALISRLRLTDAGEHPLLVCDLKRAREHLRRRHPGGPVSLAERDRLGLVTYPGTTCLTLTSDHSCQLWLGGSRAGPGRFISPSELASFMGMDTRGGPYRAAARLLKERTLCRFLCESVPRSMGLCAARLCSHLLDCSSLPTVGSLYSGAFDALGAACQDVFSARLSFVAETCAKKRAVLKQSRSPDHCYANVEDVGPLYPASALVASPPCLLYSKANRFSTEESKLAEAQRVVGELTRIVRLLKPRLFILEQTAGLPTYCCDAYQLYLSMWDGLPYFTKSYIVDAHRNCGGSHYRKRLILVAIALGPA